MTTSHTGPLRKPGVMSELIHNQWYDHTCATPLEQLAADVEQRLERWLTELGLAAASSPKCEAHRALDVIRSADLHMGGEPLALVLRTRHGQHGVFPLSAPGSELTAAGMLAVASIEPSTYRGGRKPQALVSACHMASSALCSRLDRARKASRDGSDGADAAESKAMWRAFKLLGYRVVIGAVTMWESRTGLDGCFLAASDGAAGPRARWHGGNVILSWTSSVPQPVLLGPVLRRLGMLEAMDTPAGPAASGAEAGPAPLQVRAVWSTQPMLRPVPAAGRSRLLGVLEGAVNGDAYTGEALERPGPDKMQPWFWRVPAGLWLTGTAGASPAVLTRRAAGLFAGVDPVVAALTAVNGIEPLWGPLAKDPVAGLSLQAVWSRPRPSADLPAWPERADAPSAGTRILTVRWAGCTSASRLNFRVPGDEDAIEPLPASSVGGEHTRDRRWLVPAEDAIDSLKLHDADEPQPPKRRRAPVPLERAGGAAQGEAEADAESPGHDAAAAASPAGGSDGRASPSAVTPALDAASPQPDAASPPKPPASLASPAGSAASAPDPAASAPADPMPALSREWGDEGPAPTGLGFRPLPPRGPLLPYSAARRKCEYLIGSDVPLASRCLVFARALRRVAALGEQRTSAADFARQQLEAAVGRADLHGVPGAGGFWDGVTSAASAARSGVRERRQERTGGAAVLSDLVLGRDGDSLTSVRQRVMLTGSRVSRGVARTAQSLLMHAPGASSLAAARAVIRSAASTVAAALGGDDPLPPAEGVHTALQVLMGGEPCPMVAPDAAGAGARGAAAPARRIKGAVPGGLLSRFAVLAGRMAGARGIAVLWRALVTELRARWERREAIPHTAVLASEPADMSHCLLQQKLSLLAWCTARLSGGETWDAAVAADAEASEAARLPAAAAVPATQAGPAKSCPASSATQPLAPSAAATPAKAAAAASAAPDATPGTAEAWDLSGVDEAFSSPAAKPPAPPTPLATELFPPAAPAAVCEPAADPEGLGRAGHLRPLPRMVLLRSRLQMWEPETQPAAAFTEDTLLEQQAMLARLGSSAEATALRAGMHARGLRSDMASFKAANPTCCFADFVRWHSPSDWIVRSDDPDDHERCDVTRLDGVLSRRLPGAVAVLAGTDDSADDRFPPAEGAREPEPYGSGNDGDDGNGNSDDDEDAGSEPPMWVVSWRDAPPTTAREQTPVVEADREGERALEYLETLPLEELMSLLFAASASNAAHVLEHAVEGVAGRSTACAFRTGLARRALADAAAAASAVAIAACRVGVEGDEPTAGRGVPGSSPPSGRSGLESRLGRQQGRVAALIGEACCAVCAVADAETALARFAALSHHLDAPQSRASMAWRAAAATLEAPVHADDDRAALQQSTLAAAILCGGCVIAPGSGGRDGAGSRAADDALREDAGYWPPSLDAGSGSGPAGHLVPPAPASDPASTTGGLRWHSRLPFDVLDDEEDEEDEMAQSLAEHGDGTMAAAAALAIDDDDDEDDARKGLPARVQPRLGSVLSASQSAQAIDAIAAALRHEAIAVPAAPSRRLCVSLQLDDEESCAAAGIPSHINLADESTTHCARVSALELAADTPASRVFACMSPAGARVCAIVPDDPSLV